ncbi:MerR family transcriptional regulator [Bdellovibrio sp. HCB274]|uniref:MerR family transcriptional regulator n=1 Tax=Bdellovibrio sp. HCB274 TaxID=3394361 RepID=UPI0039B4B969
MKNWLTIGQFAKEIGVSAKALRLYEDMGLLKSHVRGENGYRYYDEAQLEIARRLKDFKDLGFTLVEIKSLLEVNQSLNVQQMTEAMTNRLKAISEQSDLLKQQEHQITNILSSLKKGNEPLKAKQRRAILRTYGQVSIVVTGIGNLSQIATCIQKYFKNANVEIPVIEWTTSMVPPEQKPHIVLIHEDQLSSDGVDKIHPDVVVIKSMSTSSEEVEEQYLRLYTESGPHMSTVFNGDDRASINLAASDIIREGRTFYTSKNKGLKDQIHRIGGAVSDGEVIDLFAFNLASPREDLKIKLKRIMGLEEEMAIVSSLVAVMDSGFKKEHLQTDQITVL